MDRGLLQISVESARAFVCALKSNIVRLIFDKL